MVNIIVELSKYVIILLMICYTFSCFSVFIQRNTKRKKSILLRQNILMFLMQFVAYIVMFLQTEEMELLFFYLAQLILLTATIILYVKIYPKVSRLIVNNMCMLLCIGFIMITRLDYDNAIKQFVVVAGSMTVSLIVPVIIRKLRILSDWTWLYAGVGVAALLFVAVLGQTSYGAKLGFTIAGISVQPSEFVKILFVFFVAASLSKSTSFRDVVKVSVAAALHVLILVASTDLGAALIFFIVYLVMLYVASRQPLYMIAGLGAGSGAAFVAFHLFSHVKTRVVAWQDPFAVYNEGGYQVAQSLFAIATGGWFGMGLYQGMPDQIPVAESDFVFSAISEEMGLIFSLCLILVCVSCYVMFLNIAMQIYNLFYKLIALGLGTCYIFQVFLTIGGVTKFIPSTGVTLPLVSYGGSSILSTLIMFGIIQGLYILREDEEEEIERQDYENERTSGRKTRKTKKRQTQFDEVEKQRIR